MKIKKSLLFAVTLFVASCQKEDNKVDMSAKTYSIDVNQNCFSVAKNAKFEDSYTEDKIYNMKKIRNIGLCLNIISHTDGTGRDLDMALLKKQVEILNQNFNGNDPNFADYTPNEFKSKAAGDTKLRFYIKSVKRIKSEYVIQKGQPEWFKTKEFGIVATNPKRYVNVWIADYVLNEEGNIFSGYSSLPGDDKPNEGVVVGSQFIYDTNPKIPYIKTAGLSKGKILAHEIGHLLGLYHLSGMYGACTDDLVSDTPPAATNQDGIAKYPVIEECDGVKRSQMYSNFMTYTHETQRTMFTQGQRNKMYYHFRPGGTHEYLGTL